MCVFLKFICIYFFLYYRGPCVRKLLTGLIMYIYPLKIKNIVLYCMLGVSKHIDECAAGLTPQFTIFPFYKILSPSEGVRKNKERFFILKYKPVLNDLELR